MKNSRSTGLTSSSDSLRKFFQTVMATLLAVSLIFAVVADYYSQLVLKQLEYMKLQPRNAAPFLDNLLTTFERYREYSMLAYALAACSVLCMIAGNHIMKK